LNSLCARLTNSGGRVCCVMAVLLILYILQSAVRSSPYALGRQNASSQQISPCQVVEKQFCVHSKWLSSYLYSRGDREGKEGYHPRVYALQYAS
jgi:hypothetical protein